jgi:WD40 repeat protein
VAGVLAAPDGRFFVFASDDGWALDGRTGEPTRTKWIADVASFHARFAGDTALLAPKFGSGGNLRIRVWDWKEGRAQPRRDGIALGPQRWAHIVPSPDGKVVLVSGPELRLFEVATGKIVWGGTFDQGHIEAVTQLRFSADGRRLASAAADGTVRVWDVVRSQPLGWWTGTPSTGAPEWTGNDGWGFGQSYNHPMDLSADGRRLVLTEPEPAKATTSLRVIDTDTGRTIARRALPLGKPVGGWPELPGSIGFTPDGTAVVATFGVSDSDGVFTPSHTQFRWDFRADSWLPAGRVEPAPVSRTASARSRAVRYSFGFGVDTATGRSVVELLGAGLGPLALSADDRLIAGVGRLKLTRTESLSSPAIRDLRVWDARTGDVLAEILWTPPPAATGTGWLSADEPSNHLRWAWPRVMALHPSGRMLATVDLHGVRLWDVATGRVVRTYPMDYSPAPEYQHGRPAGAVAFTPDGTRLAIGMLDGTILLWPVFTQQQRALTSGEGDRLWTDLVGSEAGKGWRAAWRLQDDPAAAVRLVQANLKPAEPVPESDVRKWLVELDAVDFRTREAATKRLEGVIDRIVPAVTAALNVPGASAERRERLKRVLTAAPSDDRPLPAWAAGLSRAVAVLEHVGTAEAKQLLDELAAGAKGAFLTREARAALDRLAATRTDQ